MRFLFDGKYAPLTDMMSFLKAPIDDVITAYEQWIEGQFIPIPHEKKEFSGDFEHLLLASLPFSDPWNNVFFDVKNGWTGHYASIDSLTYAAKNVARILDVTMIYVTAWPSMYKRVVNGWGGGVFSLQKGDESIRHIMLSDQDGWEFDNYGEPFPFEDVERYRERFARNRFTPEMLDKYLKEFGIDFFNEDFYMPLGSKAYLLRSSRPILWEKSLDEVRKKHMYE